MKLEPNTTLSHYNILSEIGKGGMGEVYLAEDKKLDRKVALKILPAEFAKDKDRMGRFVREAQLVSALNHPNIITIYEINEIENTHFIATEFIDGKTLSDYAEDNPLGFQSALEIAIQVVSALDEAHEAGIVHRDIKPDNVMVRENGLVKILDFGIAKVTAAATSDEEAATAIMAQTQAGMIIGTPNYMSPEQARGKDVDHQTDIFSFGVVLYEMLSGTSPFSGETVSDVIAAVLTTEPRTLSNVPPELSEILNKTLRKDKNIRYQTARDLLQDLKEAKEELNIQSRLERTSSPNLEEPKTQMLPTPTTAEKARTSTTETEDGFRMAVLPFKYRGENAELETLSEGLSDEIVTGLSRFPYLRVISRSAALSNEVDGDDRQKTGEEFNIRYVLEGSLRQVGTTVRVAVQLVDTATGEHLWAETYDRKLEDERIFEIQDELVSRVVSTIADWHGVLVHSMAGSIRSKDKIELTPDEAVLYVFGYIERLSPEEHLAARDLLERITEEFPDKGNCHAMLAILYCNEYMYGFNQRPDPLGRALAAAQKAVELEPANYLASQSLAFAYFFRREFSAFETLVMRTLALNRMCGGTVAIFGVFYACKGEWERGCELSREAMELNPHFPGWYRLPFIFNAYRQKDYQEALNETQKINIPNYFWTLVMRVATLGQLGESEKAKVALNELLASRPDIAGKTPDEFGHWLDAELVEDLMEGLGKAGFEITTATDQEELKTQILQAAATTENQSQNSIAVLPFTNMSADEDNEYFCDGLAEELLNALSKIEGLKVAARTSAFSFKGKNANVTEIGEKLSVKNVLEGSVRKSGDKLRISVQLVNAADGYQLWSERYDREMKDIFDVQDEIALAVVDVLKVKLFDDQKIARKYQPKLPAYEAFLKGRYKYYKFSPESFAEAEEHFKEAIELDRAWADPISALGDVYYNLGFYGWRPHVETISLAQESARMALELDPTQAMAHAVLGAISGLHDYDWEEAENQFRLSNVSYSHEPDVHYYHAMFYLLPLGRFDEAKSEMDIASSSDPLNVMWHARKAWICFCGGEYEDAITQANKALEIDDKDYQALLMIALSYFGQGNLSKAQSFSEKVYKLAPWDGLGTGLHAGILAKVGENDRAQEVFSNLTGTVTFGTMIFHLVSGEIDSAIDWFQKVVDSRRPNAAMVANSEFCKPLRMNPRWSGLAKQMNLPEPESASVSHKEIDEPLEIVGETEAEPQENMGDTSGRQSLSAHRAAKPKSVRNKLIAVVGIAVVLSVLAFLGYRYLSTVNQIDSIAVMPFVNESGNADVEYLSDGMTETLISSLSNLPNVNVKSRSSVFRYKGKNTAAKTIGTELNVQAILNGRIVQRGDQLSLNLELVDTEEENVIWSGKYDRKTSDLVTLQSEIARDVSTKLKSKLSGAEEAKVTNVYTTNSEAYQLYLKGNYFTSKLTKEGFRKGNEFFEQAILLDPKYALAYNGIAFNQVTAMDWFIEPKVAGPKARDAVNKAAEINDELAETQLLRGMVAHWIDWDWKTAESAYKRAIELNPTGYRPHGYYAWFLANMGRNEEAVESAKKAQQLDPINPEAHWYLGMALLAAGRTEEAIARLKVAIELDPTYFYAYTFLGRAYLQAEKKQEALAAFKKAFELESENSENRANLGFAYGVTGNRVEAEKIIKALEAGSSETYVAPYYLAIAYAGLGDKERTLKYLDRAYADRSDSLVLYVTADPQMDGIRNDPRYKDLLKRIGLPE